MKVISTHRSVRLTWRQTGLEVNALLTPCLGLVDGLSGLKSLTWGLCVALLGVSRGDVVTWTAGETAEFGGCSRTGEANSCFTFGLMAWMFSLTSTASVWHCADCWMSCAVLGLSKLSALELGGTSTWAFSTGPGPVIGCCDCCWGWYFTAAGWGLWICWGCCWIKRSIEKSK